jgi:hypothetical protein
MAITLTDVELAREFRIFTEVVNGTTNVYGVVSYRILTDSARTFNGQTTVQLTGAVKTRAATLFDDLKALAKTQEGIS